MAVEEPRNLLSAGKRHGVAMAVTSLAAAGIISQLTLLREMLCVVSGNELSLGIVLGNWLVLMGLGASLGRAAGRVRNPLRLLTVLLILLAAGGPLELLAVRLLPGAVLAPGESPDVGQCVAGSLVLLGPYCVTAGFVLALAAGVLEAREGAWGAARVYVADAVGGAVGGAVFWMLAGGLLGHMDLLCVAAAGQLVVAAVLAIVFGRRGLAAIAAVGVLTAMTVTIATDLGGYSTRVQYPADEMLYRGNTPRGRLVVTHTQGQLRFLLSGQTVLSTRNFAHAEETVHFAMSQRPDAERVLLISGGPAGTAAEVLNYPWVSDVVCVEPEPEVLRLARRFLPGAMANPRIHTRDQDPRTFLHETQMRFDVVIVDLAAPDTLAAGRFYTREFLSEAAAVLDTDGVLAVGVVTRGLSEGRHRTQGAVAVAGTLRQRLPNLLVVPGTTRTFLLASAGPLHADIEAQLTDAGIRTTLLTPEYLAEVLSPQRMASAAAIVGASQATAGETLDPRLYWSRAGRWLAQVNLGFSIGVGLLGAAMGIFFLRLRAGGQALFAGGFALWGVLVTAMLGLQSICGTLPGQLGPLAAVTMLGLVVGAMVGKGISPAGLRGRLVVVAVSLAACGALVGPMLTALAAWSHQGASDSAVAAAIAAAMFAVSAVAGMAFPVTAQAAAGHGASRLFTVYFFGGFLGAVVVGVVSPVLVGLVWAPAVAAAVSIVAVASLAVRRV